MAEKHKYGSPEDVAQRILEWLGQNARQDATSLLLYEAMQALKKCPTSLAAPPAAANQAGIPEAKTVDELAMLVRQLVHSLRKAAPDNDLPNRAVDYLRRRGLQGSVLRAAPHPTESHALGGGDE